VTACGSRCRAVAVAAFRTLTAYAVERLGLNLIETIKVTPNGTSANEAIDPETGLANSDRKKIKGTEKQVEEH